MSFSISEMSFPILAEMSFGQNAQKKSLSRHFPIEVLQSSAYKGNGALDIKK